MIPWNYGGKYIINKCGVPVASELIPNYQPFDTDKCNATSHRCDDAGLGFRPIIDRLLSDVDGC
eukprot:m.218888 g.218888  ORF g.218888 m.218888 type:complete len:64 (+) comp33279_c0_seq1:586-777(+)